MGVNRKRGVKGKEEDTPTYECGLLWGEPYVSVLKCKIAILQFR